MAGKGPKSYTPIKELLASGVDVLNLPRQIRLLKTEIDAIPLLPKNLKSKSGKLVKRIDFKFTDSPSLILRVGTSSKTFCVVSWVRGKGKEQRVTIGQYGDKVEYELNGEKRFDTLTAFTAGVIAAETRSKLRHGIDVNEETKRAEEAAQEAKEAADKELTINRLAEEYLEKYARKNKRASSVKEDERLLDKDVLPRWGKRKAKSIRKRDVVLLLEEMSKRGPALANNIFKLVRRMFNFAVERDILEFTPCSGVKIDNIAPITSRDRVLRDAKTNGGTDEILTFWMELEKASMTPQVKGILRLILITGQRPGEVAGINASELTEEHHEENGRKWTETWWTIPVARRKVKEKSKHPPQPHRVFLSPMALEILEEMKPGAIGGYFFSSPKATAEAPKPIDQNAVAYAVRRNLKDYQPRRPIKGDEISMVKVSEKRKMAIEHFTPHDLRRTFSTRLAELGFSDEINDAVLGHVKQGVIRVYNRHQYDREKKQAMLAWDRKLSSILSGQPTDNVVPLTKGGSQ